MSDKQRYEVCCRDCGRWWIGVGAKDEVEAKLVSEGWEKRGEFWHCPREEPEGYRVYEVDGKVEGVAFVVEAADYPGWEPGGSFARRSDAVAACRAHAKAQYRRGLEAAVRVACNRCHDERVSVIQDGEYKGRHVFVGDVLDYCPAEPIRRLIEELDGEH